ncbi:hypothetical protein HYY69_08285 [Candidatus Woesearchaeota archaeon]|nr:hypothetical protein [Candidatus Woesearchaeota archaeon]
MLNPSIILKHYKRKDIAEAMIKASQNREVAFKFGEDGFGKRPDIVTYPQDILEVARQGCTSLHVSEEHWSNPLQLSPTLKKDELDDLRIGWDLVLDIDCKFWEYAKYIAHLLVEELKAHGVNSISVKFSGSKGFHIGVPFAAFPDTVQGKETRLLFPEAPKRISLYLKDRIEPKLVEYLLSNKSKESLAKELHKENIEQVYCKKCSNKQEISQQTSEFVCPQCQKKIIEARDMQFQLCPDCKTIEMMQTTKANLCKKCNSKEFIRKYDLSEVLEIDTILISSRHLYRMPFSLHEKTGLCSVPIPLNSILSFEKQDALPSKITTEIIFLDSSSTINGEAGKLLFNAFEYKPVITYEDPTMALKKEFDIPEQAIPIDLFPPCMLKGLQGMNDGKKRFMFALSNFLEKVGWQHQQIESLLLQWNEKNAEQLREVIIRGQLNHRKATKKKMLPPNCMSFYQDLGVCQPDHLCQKIKNPVQYATRKAFIVNQQLPGINPSARQKLTEEQKEMRRKHREEIKKQKESAEIDNNEV